MRPFPCRSRRRGSRMCCGRSAPIAASRRRNTSTRSTSRAAVSNPPLLGRLVGLETEYALRYHAHQPGTPRPTNLTLFERLLARDRAKVPAVRTVVLPHVWFLANGGAVRFERLPFLPAAEAGVVEGGTPECRGPRQLLLYQRAQDLLLSRATAADDGDGRATLVKHTRDGRANVYGTHENYEMVLASGAGLWLWRLALALLTPVVLVLAIALVLVLLLIFALLPSPE